MYTENFWIIEAIGNNAFSYEQRKQLSTEPKLFVANCVVWDLENVCIGKEVCFEETDKSGVIKSFVGLDQFVEIQQAEKKIYVMDNHNHALFFWGKEVLNGSVSKWISVVHIDQHSDLNIPKKSCKNIPLTLKNLFDYTNFVCNVGDFIVPAQERWLIGTVIQVRTEWILLDFIAPKEKFILDIDLDFWAPEMGIIEYKKTITMTKKLIQAANLITIATSPFFLDQKKALSILNDILW